MSVAVREQRDGVVGCVDAGEQGALVGDDSGDIARTGAGIHRDRRLEAPRLVRHALPKEDIARAVDDGHVGDAVAVQVGHERACSAAPGRPKRAGANWPFPWFSSIATLLGSCRRDGQVVLCRRR